MRVLFDFDLFGITSVDTHLLDVLLGLKKAIIVQMTPFVQEINERNGEFIITMIPKDFNISYSCRNPESSNPRILEIINSYDWLGEIKKFSKSELN